MSDHAYPDTTDADRIVNVLCDLVEAVRETRSEPSEITVRMPYRIGDPDLWRATGYRQQYRIDLFNTSLDYVILEAIVVRPGLVELTLLRASGDRFGVVKLVAE